MKGRKRFIVLLITAFMIIGLTPGAAVGGGNGLKATFEGGTEEPDFTAPGCPETAEWRFTGAGTGTMETKAYEGAFTYELTHCSRFFTNPFTAERTTGKFVGKSEVGIFEIFIGDWGEEPALVLEYEATWVFEAVDLTVDPPIYLSDINGHYTITGGTGDFANAKGHGRMFATGGIYLEGLLNGSLNVK